MALLQWMLVLAGSIAFGDEPVPESPCDGVIGNILHIAPECFEPCKPDICEALVIGKNAFLTNQPGATRQAVCENLEPYKCLFKGNHTERCAPLIEFATKLKIPMPESPEDLEAHCAAAAADDGRRTKESELLIQDAEEPAKPDVNAVACSGHVVGELVRKAPACFAPCEPRVCEALAGARRIWERDHSVKNTREFACKDLEPFQCLFQGNYTERCASLIMGAKELQIPFPESVDDLQSHCDNGAAHDERKERERTSTTTKTDKDWYIPYIPLFALPEDPQRSFQAEIEAEIFDTFALEILGSVSPCRTGFLGMVHAFEPRCFEPCKPTICSTLQGAIDVYHARKSVPETKKYVCENQEQYSCLLEPDHVKNCDHTLKQARRFGVALPLSKQELEDQCSEVATLSPEQAVVP